MTEDGNNGTTPPSIINIINVNIATTHNNGGNVVANGGGGSGQDRGGKSQGWIAGLLHGVLAWFGRSAD